MKNFKISELADKKILEIGNVNDIVSDEYIVPHIGVSFTGRSSGHKEFLFLDGEIVFYDLHMDQTRYRFKNLMQVRVTGKISNFVGTPTKDGDSGAWLCTQNHKGTSWCAMIIGDLNKLLCNICGENYKLDYTRD